MHRRVPGGSKATMLADRGPQSTVFIGAVRLTSHIITLPAESHEAIMLPWKPPQHQQLTAEREPALYFIANHKLRVRSTSVTTAIKDRIRTAVKLKGT